MQTIYCAVFSHVLCTYTFCMLLAVLNTDEAIKILREEEEHTAIKVS
jgi:hypothetical protein